VIGIMVVAVVFVVVGGGSVKMVLAVTQGSAISNEISLLLLQKIKCVERLFPTCKFKWAFMICSPKGRHLTMKQTPISLFLL